MSFSTQPWTELRGETRQIEFYVAEGKNIPFSVSDNEWTLVLTMLERNWAVLPLFNKCALIAVGGQPALISIVGKTNMFYEEPRFTTSFKRDSHGRVFAEASPVGTYAGSESVCISEGRELDLYTLPSQLSRSSM